MPRPSKLKDFLTIAYLIWAFVVTAATSKGRGHPITPYGADTITNYAIQSNCPLAPDVVALQVQNMAITRTIHSDGSVNSAPALDFTRFGFPQPQVVIGMDQVGAASSS